LQAEIGQQHPALPVQQNILGFYIAVNYPGPVGFRPGGGQLFQVNQGLAQRYAVVAFRAGAANYPRTTLGQFGDKIRLGRLNSKSNTRRIWGWLKRPGALASFCRSRQTWGSVNSWG